MMSRIWKVILVVLMTSNLVLASTGSVPSGDPYYGYIKSHNKKLGSRDIAKIINANKKFSAKYNVDMFWHICKTGYESGFKSEVGNSFYGDKKDPCYGIERMNLSTVRGMHPEMTDSQLRNNLLHNYEFAIECAYRLDYANAISATKMGFTKPYTNRVVWLIMYNAGLGGWQKRHTSLAHYVKHGGKLENLTVNDWKKLQLNFHEIYSLHYYVNILEEADELNQLIKDMTPPKVENKETVAPSNRPVR